MSTETSPQHFQAASDELQNKVILVTGAGDGIGRQAALSFAQCGATVILLGRTVKKLEAVYDEIEALGAPQPAIIPLDLKGATQQNYLDMAATIENQFGRLDGALLNAAHLGVLSQYVQIEEDLWDQLMQVNVKSQFLLSQALVPLMLKSDHASLVFTSSSVGKKGRAYWGGYSVSKFAIEGMSQVIADEFDKTGLRSNCINPGATRTLMRATAYPGEDPKTLKTPLDIMPNYLYLMSDASIGVTGTSLDAQPK
ncbi:YciK family oxidoreductase [Agarivorans sp. OAG1]|uniref:Putative oxidoreductase n=1 Tax=Agarivorans albus MKT 106 TaxID=1331007 RepID=R9PPN2_AGAAL|nr:YciK family oxidoreductase [Agarivorans albus]BEU03442.1 YciK family oxidoreductase [Agarivorans sp. OAG1]GAD03270.1 putative oxidoreductase [Agarivorans albus MKT 106]